MNTLQDIQHPTRSYCGIGEYIKSFAASFAAGSQEKQKNVAGFGVVTNRLRFFYAHNITAKVSQIKANCQFFLQFALAPAGLLLGWPFLCHQTTPNMPVPLLLPTAPQHPSQQLSPLQVCRHYGHALYTVTAFSPQSGKVLTYTHANLHDALVFLETLETNEQGGVQYE